MCAGSRPTTGCWIIPCSGLTTAPSDRHEKAIAKSEIAAEKEVSTELSDDSSTDESKKEVSAEEDTSEEIQDKDVLFVCNTGSKDAVAKLLEGKYSFTDYPEHVIMQKIIEMEPDLVVNDILDVMAVMIAGR